MVRRWIFRDGELSRFKHASKITRRDPATLRPVSHEIDFTDQSGREYHFTGRITASAAGTT